MQGAIETKPQTDLELYHWIESYCRNNLDEPIVMPHVAVCQGHVAPFTFIADAFFKRVTQQFLKANRSGSKTLSFGLLAFLEMFFEGLLGPGPLQVLDIGATQLQGDKCFEYAECLWKQDEFSGYLGRWGALKQSITLPDKTQLKVATATMKGTNSPHVPRVFLDELELWEWKILQQALSIAQETRYHVSCTRLGSTQKTALGHVQDWLDHAAERGYKVYQWCIWETIQRCPPERECKGCPLYEWPDDEGGILCGGRARHSSGYYHIEDFIKKVMGLDRDTLETEWLCLRPSRKGLVFGREYNEARHRVPFVIPYTTQLPLELALDQGFTNPFAVLFIQRDQHNDQNRIINELYETQTLAEDMGRRTADVLEQMKVPNSQKIIAWPDPEDPAAAHAFARHCVSTKGTRYNLVLRSPRGRPDLQEYLRDVRIALTLRPQRPPRTIMGAGVSKLPWEFTQYRYPEPKSEARPVTEVPLDKDNHAISAYYRYLSQFRAGGGVRTAKDPRRR